MGIRMQKLKSIDADAVVFYASVIGWGVVLLFVK